MNVLIVEDERFTAQSIARLVSDHPACSVAGMASNGAEAIRQMDQHPADLVITDIRMPVMDGMELLRQLCERYPQTFTVVLSGYSDFEYARTALQCQAFDYLLKPVVKSTLFPLLDKVSASWNERRHNQTRIRLQQALDGMIVPCNDSKRYDLILSPPSPIPPEPIFGTECYCFRSAFEQILLVEDGKNTPEKAAEYLGLLKTDVPVNLICTANPVPICSLQATTSHLRRALKQQVHMYRSEVFVTDTAASLTEPEDSTSLRDLRPSRAVDAICTRNRRSLQDCLLEALSQPDIRRIDVQNFLDAILGDTRLSYHISPDRLSQKKAALTDQISRAVNPADCAVALADDLLAPKNTTTSKHDTTAIVQEIARQLDTDFHLPFTTEGLARQHGLTPRYLNKAFKEYKGVRPMEYLVNLRMKRARFILETMPDAMIKDIATSVGYTDPLYFSKTFKKETGLWPKEYQDAQKEKSKSSP